MLLRCLIRLIEVYSFRFVLFEMSCFISVRYSIFFALAYYQTITSIGVQWVFIIILVRLTRQTKQCGCLTFKYENDNDVLNLFFYFCVCVYHVWILPPVMKHALVQTYFFIPFTCILYLKFHTCLKFVYTQS